MLFPCSGLKEGIVDVGFHLNYTAVGSRDERHLNIVIRRHCNRNSKIQFYFFAIFEEEKNIKNIQIHPMHKLGSMYTHPCIFKGAY